MPTCCTRSVKRDATPDQPPSGWMAWTRASAKTGQAVSNSRERRRGTRALSWRASVGSSRLWPPRLPDTGVDRSRRKATRVLVFALVATVFLIGYASRIMRRLHLSLILVALAGVACHPGPVIDTGAKPPVDGTIAGIVSTEGNAALPGRRVSAIDTSSGAKFEATTGANGGYTMKVPEGTYRLEVEVRPGEKVTKQPGETRINRSDLDPRRDFVISSGGAAG